MSPSAEPPRNERTEPEGAAGPPRRKMRRRRRRRRVDDAASPETRPLPATEERPRRARARTEEPARPPRGERRETRSDSRPPRPPREGDRDRDRGRERREERPPRPAAPPEVAADGAAGFGRFGLPEPLLRALAAAGYAKPTEVQERMLPVALEGRNVVARSRTGTGKTCAFFLPALTGLEEVRTSKAESVPPRGPVRVLVVVPTRELAAQVAQECVRLSRFVPVATACVYGGTQMARQFRELPRSAVVVGTPGRLLDHMRRRTFDAKTVEVLVLDEVDRMYDLGFRDDVDRIVEACASRRQTILVSATLTEDVEELIRKHVGAHERIEIESRTLTVDEVEQLFYVVEPDRKRELLVQLLHTRDPERTLVFTRTRFTADRVAYVLQREGFQASEIHSGLPQRRREEILRRFREGKLALLVATDVAARGLDIEGVDHVINYDIPHAPEDYVHRVGRTARMGREGWAVTLVCPDDGAYLTAIEKLINKEIEQQRFEGFEPKRAEVKPPEQKPVSAQPAKEQRIPGIPRWARPARRRRR